MWDFRVGIGYQPNQWKTYDLGFFFSSSFINFFPLCFSSFLVSSNYQYNIRRQNRKKQLKWGITKQTPPKMGQLINWIGTRLSFNLFVEESASHHLRSLSTILSLSLTRTRYTKIRITTKREREKDTTQNLMNIYMISLSFNTFTWQQIRAYRNTQNKIKFNSFKPWNILV